MEFSIKFDTFQPRWFIVYIYNVKKCCIFSLCNEYVLANSVEPCEMPFVFTVCQSKRSGVPGFHRDKEKGRILICNHVINIL